MKLPGLFLIVGLFSAPIMAYAQPLIVLSKTVRPAEMDTLRFLEIQFAGGKFTLVPPLGCGLNTDLPSATIQLSASTGFVSMTIQFSTNNSRTILASREALQHHSAPTGVRTEVRDEFPAYSGTTTGKGIELTFNLHGHPMWRRAAVIPFSGGFVSFIATAPANESKAAQQLFGGVITSFQNTSSDQAAPGD